MPNREISLLDITKKIMEIYNKEFDIDLTNYDVSTIEQIYVLMTYIEIEKGNTKLCRLNENEIVLLVKKFEILFFDKHNLSNSNVIDNSIADDFTTQKTKPIGNSLYNDSCKSCMSISNELNIAHKNQNNVMEPQINNLENKSSIETKNKECCKELIEQLTMKIDELESTQTQNEKYNEINSDFDKTCYRIDVDVIKRMESELVNLKNLNEIENNVICTAWYKLAKKYIDEEY
ncbi:hypothetical protein BDAP_002842 [Binucleata daphniae]